MRLVDTLVGRVLGLNDSSIYIAKEAPLEDVIAIQAQYKPRRLDSLLAGIPAVKTEEVNSAYEHSELANAFMLYEMRQLAEVCVQEYLEKSPAIEGNDFKENTFKRGEIVGGVIKSKSLQGEHVMLSISIPLYLDRNMSVRIAYQNVGNGDETLLWELHNPKNSQQPLFEAKAYFRKRGRSQFTEISGIPYAVDRNMTNIVVAREAYTGVFTDEGLRTPITPNQLWAMSGFDASREFTV